MKLRWAFRLVVGLGGWFAARFYGVSSRRWLVGVLREAGPRREVADAAVTDAEALAPPPTCPPDQDRWR